MRQRNAIRIAGAMLVTLPLLAVAQESDERPGFDEADADGDGAVSVEEATEIGVPESEAKREDIDNDGELTKADWQFVDMNPEQSSGASS